MNLILGKYKNKRKLGKGAYGEVLLVEDSNGNEFALKRMSKKEMSAEPYLYEYLESEKQCMMRVENKYVMELVSVEEDQNEVYFLCQYCNGGDLLNYQAKQPGKVFSLEDATAILSNVIHGLYLLHSMGYIHRDIKPQNILVKSDGPESKMFKLADFGFAKKKQKTSGSVLGTPNYMAPQIYSNQIYSFEVDMWAFGVLFYVMLNNDLPFKLNPHLSISEKKKEIIQFSQNFSFAEKVQRSSKKLTKNCSQDMEDLFKRMLNPNPEQRISFSEIREHPVFRKYFHNDNGNSKILYESKKKSLDKAQSFIESRSGILKQGLKKSSPPVVVKNIPEVPKSLIPLGLSVVNESSDSEDENPQSMQKQTSKPHQQLIELQYSRINFLLECADILSSDEITFLESAETLALEYNLHMYYLLLIREFNCNLVWEVYQKKYGTLNWIDMFKSTEFEKLKQNYASCQKNIQTKITQLSAKCQKSLSRILKYNPKFVIFSQTNQPKTFTDSFKQSYRTSTMKAYCKARQEVSKCDRNFYLSFVVALCHGFNQIMAATEEELEAIFGSLRLTKANLIMDFRELGQALESASKKELLIVFQEYFSRYFSQ